MRQRKDDNRNHTGFMRNHDRQASNLFLGARILLGRAPRNEVVAAPTVEDLIGGLVIGGRAAPPEVVPDPHQGALGDLVEEAVNLHLRVVEGAKPTGCRHQPQLGLLGARAQTAAGGARRLGAAGAARRARAAGAAAEVRRARAARHGRQEGPDEASGGLEQLEPFGRARQWFYGVAREGATGSGMVRQRLCRRQGTTGSGKGSMGLQERRYAPLSPSPCIVGDPSSPC